LADLQAGLAAVPGVAGRLAVLTGGEPFLRSDLLRLLAVLRAAGCSPGIISTGRPLVYPQLRERLRRIGLTYLRLQLFGIGAVHDRATALAGSFDQALAGLDAWVAEAGTTCDVDVALSTRGRTLDALVGEIESLSKLLPARDVQIVVALDPALQEEMRRDASTGQSVLAALAGWNDDATHPLLVWEGLPSAFPGAAVLPLRPAFVGRMPDACCLGAVGDLVRARAGSREEVQANSFNFVRTETVVPWVAEANACKAHIIATADPGSQLWLSEDENKDLVLYETDTGDFRPAAIERIKNEWSHLFVDRAPAGVLDDFTEGMRRVVPDETCFGCDHRAGCGRRFVVVEGAPFAREEAWIRNHIVGLRGQVLDVGCGEQLYRDEIGRLLAAGTIRYTGLDPDALSLSHARAALPQGRFHLGGIEDYRGVPASCDHILCLRSLNHVVDIDEAMARMATLLKPGGTLLAVETTPFAMLRRPQQVAAADQAPRAGHQHLRNVTSEEVLPFARRRSLEVVEHHPASRQGTNEWILLLRKPSY